MKREATTLYSTCRSGAAEFPPVLRKIRTAEITAGQPIHMNTVDSVEEVLELTLTVLIRIGRPVYIV